MDTVISSRRAEKSLIFMRAWERDNSVMLYSQRGGQIYEKGYHEKYIDRTDSFDADT